MNDGLISERDLVMGVARASVSECKSETVISNAFNELAAAIRRMGRGRNNNDVAQDDGPDKGRVAPAAYDAALTANLPHRMQPCQAMSSGDCNGATAPKASESAVPVEPGAAGNWADQERGVGGIG